MNTTTFLSPDKTGHIVTAFHYEAPGNEPPIGSVPAPPDIPLSILLYEYWIVSGELVYVGKRPSEYHFWVNGAWEDSRSLEDFKAAKWVSIKVAREATINSPLVTPYGTFDADPKSRQNITDAILMLKSLEDLGSPSTIDFTLADDTARTLNTGEMVMVGLLLGQKIQAAHAQSRALRGALDLATTKEEVEAITWQATT